MINHTHTTPPLMQISTWSCNDMACALLQRRELGGMGLGFPIVLKLIRDLGFDGAFFKETTCDVDMDVKIYLSSVRNWYIKKDQNSTITIEIDSFKWFLITRDADCIDQNYFIEKVLEIMNVDFDESIYTDILEKENQYTNECLGDLASKKVDWPYILYKNTPKLDWRFSTDILYSKDETESISNSKSDLSYPFLRHFPSSESYQSSPKSCHKEEKTIHEHIASQVNSGDSKILILLALSGAGKSQTLFYLNTSNTTFTLPIDFGSTEDTSILLKDPLDYIKSQVSVMKENNELDERVSRLNERRVNNIKAEIEGIFALRAFMLLKLLKTRQEKKQTLLPSLWIRYLYYRGSETFIQLYKEWIIYLRVFCLNSQGDFLQFILTKLKSELVNNKQVECKHVTLTVDEINQLIRLGHGRMKILLSDNIDTPSGSVATILFRILEQQSNLVPSVISGTKIDKILLEMAVSSRIKEHISIVPFYGSTIEKQLSSFASNYLFVPKLTDGSDLLFKACCTILEGRRRSFMVFLTNIVANARRNPFPKTNDQDIIQKWKQKLILDTFLAFPQFEFVKDIDNFLNETDEKADFSTEMKNIRIDVSLYLVLKNTLHEQDLQSIIETHLPKHQQIREQIQFSIIYHGISFGKVNNGFYFESTEIVNAIHLNKVIHQNRERTEHLVSFWLKEAFSNEHCKKKMDNSKTVGLLFEIIGALIFVDIAHILNGKPLTTHPLFEEFKGTFLDDYKLSSKLSILNNKSYWNVFAMFQKYTEEMKQSSFYRDVVVFGLDKGLKVNVKTLLIPTKIDLLLLEANMTCIYTTEVDEVTFKQNNMDSQRDFFKKNVNMHKSLRILFDYSFKDIDLFEQMKRDENTHGDAIVLFSRYNKKFAEYFKQSFPQLYSTISSHYQ